MNLRLVLAIAVAILAAAPPAAAQSCFGPPLPTVSPDDAASVARACGGDAAAVAVAIALQMDRYAAWESRPAEREDGGVDAWWCRLVGAGRDAAGNPRPEVAAKISASGRVLRDDVADQRRADRALLDAIIAQSSAAAEPPVGARALASAIIRRPMIFESSVLPTDPLQFLECDPAVVARLCSAGAGPALIAAGRAVEEAMSERQRASIEATVDAAVHHGSRWSADPAVIEGDRRVAEAQRRAAELIGAVDPVAGAWLLLRGAVDRAVTSSDRGRSGDDPGAQAATQSLRSDARGMLAVVEALLTAPHDPALHALGLRCASLASALEAAQSQDPCCDPRAAAALRLRVSGAAREVLEAVPDPVSLRTDPAHVYRLASWSVEPWRMGAADGARGAGCEGLDVLPLLNAAQPVLAGLAAVDVGALPAAVGAGGAAGPPSRRPERCAALREMLAQWEATMLGAPGPEQAGAAARTMEALRGLALGMARDGAAALPAAGTPDGARAKAMREWLCEALPGLASARSTALALVASSGEPDAGARAAAIDRAVEGAMERILRRLSDAPPGAGGEDGLRFALGLAREVRRAANEIDAVVAGLGAGEQDPEWHGGRSIAGQLRALADRAPAGDDAPAHDAEHPGAAPPLP